MNRLLERFFLIKPGELSRVVLSISLIFLAAGALILLRSAADALFLDSIEIAYLPYMYIAVSVVTAVVSAFFARIADRFPRQRIIYVFYFLYAASLVGLYFLSLQRQLWVYALLYVYGNVVVVLAILKAWTYIADIFDAREAKRLFGIIGIGSTLAGVICGFGLREYTRWFSTESVINVCALFFGLGIIVTFLLNRAAAGRETPARAGRRAAPKATIGFLFRDRYLLTVGIIFTFTAFGSSFADYIFKATARGLYTGRELTSFFGMFYGVTNLITLFYSLFLSSRFLPLFGLRNSCLVLPLELLAGAVVFILHPGMWTASLLKFGDTGVRYTVHNSARQVMFMPLRREVRGRLKTYMDGIIAPVAGALAGLMLLAVTAAAGPGTLRMFAIVLAGLCAVWTLGTLPIKKGYLKALYSSLDGKGIDLDELTGGLRDPAFLRALEKELDADDDNRVIHALELLGELGAPGLGRHYLKLMQVSSPTVALYVLGRIEMQADPALYEPLVGVFKTSPPSGVLLRALAATGGGRAFGLVGPCMQKPELRVDAISAVLRYMQGVPAAEAAALCRGMAVSNDAADRLAAAAVMGYVGVAACLDAAAALAADPDPGVRSGVMKGILLTPVSAALPLALNGLFDPVCRNPVLAGIAAFPGADAALIGRYAGALRGDRLVIIEALGRTATALSASFLAGGLADEEAGIRSRIAAGLERVQAAGTAGKPDLDRVLGREVREAFILSVLAVRETDSAVKALLDAVRRDRLQTVFRMLGALGHAREMDAAIASIAAGQSLANAIELVDSRVAWKGKATLLSLIENRPEKLADVFKAQYREDPPGRDAFLFEVNDRVLNALGLHLAAVNRDASRAERCRAFLDNPDPALAEAALEWLLAFRGLAEVQRLYADADNPADSATARLVKEGKTMLSTIERVLFLKGVEIFAELGGEYLMHIASAASEHDFLDGDYLCRDGDTDRAMFVIVSGRVRITKAGREIAVVDKGGCIGEMALLDGLPRSADAAALEDVTALKLEYADFYDVLAAGNTAIAQGIFKVLSGRLRSMLSVEKGV